MSVFAYYYDVESGGLILRERDSEKKLVRTTRPVFSDELTLFGFDKYFDYDKTERRPIMWAELNSYYYRGKKIARVSYERNAVVEPRLEIVDNSDLFCGRELNAVDVDAMNEQNRLILTKLRDRTIERLETFYNERQEKYRCFYASYSGGKDSDVMMDLLRQCSFHSRIDVCFGDTGMETPYTYLHAAEFKSYCERNGIKFYIAKSRLNPADSYWLFGTPSRTMRWCCSVFKSTPCVIKIRETYGTVPICAFIGVRRDESALRSSYEFIAESHKASNQIEYRPILDWGTHEVWTWALYRNIKLNNYYRKGGRRVGCLICPLASGSQDWFAERLFPMESEPYKQAIINNNRAKIDGYEELHWEYSRWRARRNGVFLKDNLRRIKKERTEDFDCYYVRQFDSNFTEWLKILGDVKEINKEFYINCGGGKTDNLQRRRRLDGFKNTKRKNSVARTVPIGLSESS